MKRRWRRLVPIIAVAALLVATALLPSRRARARTESAAAVATTYTNCDVVVQTGGHGATVGIVNGAGVVQPLRTDMNASACSLEVMPYALNYASMDLVEWDPLALAPDPTTVTLRSRGFDASSVYYGQVHTVWAPPLVTRQAPRLAEPPRGTVALELWADHTGGSTLGVQYQTEGPPDVPIAYLAAVTGSHAPLLGAHAVLSHGVCGGDSTLQALRVVQCVRTVDALLDSNYYEVMQRFRVPVEARLRWAELAFGAVSPRSPLVFGRVAILDAAPDGPPPALLPPELVGAALGSVLTGAWNTHYDFDHIITLEPDHDYWLLARTAHDYGLYTHYRDGSEGPDYVAAIGGLYTRVKPDLGFSEQVGSTLCFKLIGEPTGVASVPDPAPAPLGLRLGITPNPARGAVLVRWSGASGALRFEVLDARGRRVAAGAEGTGTSGSWTWNAARSEGSALPAGIYFVRATDAAGHAAAARVALVR